MHLIIAFVSVAIASLAAGYGFRGLIHKEITTESAASKTDLSSFAARIERSAYSAEQTVKTELLKIAGDIRKKI